MNRALLASSLLLALALPAAAQQPTAAESAFRDAWWAESGKGDLTEALKGYLAAAAAEGPAGIRAKALLAAGGVQQRLGKTESAIATLRQLLRDFPGETDLVERARTHLREMTAVDLRDGYDEWYRRRLFSEEVQTEILQRIQELGRKVAAMPRQQQELREWHEQLEAISAEILGYGEGAVPALRKTAGSANADLASRAVGLLFRLGEVPDTAALQQHLDGWAARPENWKQLLALPPAQAKTLCGGIAPFQCGAVLLEGALQGPRAMLQGLAMVDPALVTDHPEVITAATSALLRAGADSRKATLATMTADALALRLRKAMELAVIDPEEPLPFTASEWLQIGTEPLHFELRLLCIDWAARVLQAQDGDVLDELLVRVASAPADSRQEWLERLGNGLLENLAPLQVPWTLPRLRALVRLFDKDYSLSGVLLPMLHNDAMRALLAEALLGDPAPMREAYPGGEKGPSLAMHCSWDVDDRERALLETRWNRTVAGFVDRAWPGLHENERLAELALLQQLIRTDCGDRTSLLGFLENSSNRGSQAVGDAMTALRRAWGG